MPATDTIPQRIPKQSMEICGDDVYFANPAENSNKAMEQEMPDVTPSVVCRRSKLIIVMSLLLPIVVSCAGPRNDSTINTARCVQPLIDSWITSCGIWPGPNGPLRKCHLFNTRTDNRVALATWDEQSQKIHTADFVVPVDSNKHKHILVKARKNETIYSIDPEFEQDKDDDIDKKVLNHIISGGNVYVFDLNMINELESDLVRTVDVTEVYET